MTLHHSRVTTRESMVPLFNGKSYKIQRLGNLQKSKTNTVNYRLAFICDIKIDIMKVKTVKSLSLKELKQLLPLSTKE